MKFGEILRNLIEEKDLTQKQLAIDLNITPSTLGGYVQNTREPDFETLKVFAKYFDVTIDYLLGFHTDNIKTSGEADLLRIYRSLDKEQQELYIEQGKAFIRINSKKSVNAKLS